MHRVQLAEEGVSCTAGQATIPHQGHKNCEQITEDAGGKKQRQVHHVNPVKCTKAHVELEGKP